MVMFVKGAAFGDLFSNLGCTRVKNTGSWRAIDNSPIARAACLFFVGSAGVA